MSGDIQARKRKGKGRKKDDGEEDVTETKAKIIVNDSKHGNNNGKGEGSGVVAKIFFLILLVSLSLVVGLILVELRGKQAAVKESRSMMPDAEELYTPEPIEPEVHEEPVPEAPPPVQQEDTNEEYEPIEATPPLEEYIKVVEKVVETPQEEPAPEDDSFFQAEEADVVEEVVEVVEEIPVEEVVEIVEEVIEVPALEEGAEPVGEEPSEEIQQEAEEEGEMEEKVKEEIVQEEVKKEEQEEVKEDQEAVSSQEEKDEPVAVEEKAEIVEEKAEEVEEKAEVVEEKAEVVEEKAKVVEEKEEVVADQEDDTTEGIEEVEEPVVAEDVQELDAPVEETSVDDNEDEDSDQDDDDDDEEKEVDDDDDDDDDDDNDGELTEEEAEAVQEVLEESIDSLVEDLESLTKAYIRVEALAEDIRSVDPENEMVAQLVPHIAGVLRALESGHTEGLADTLNHIEIILLDIQRRLPVDQPAESPQTPETEAASEPAIGTEPELVVADSEPLSSPEATDESEPAEPQEVEAPVAQPQTPVEEESEPHGVDEPEAAALVSEPVVVESESVVDSSEAQVESSESIEQSIVGEAEPIEEEVEEAVEEEPQKEQYVVEEREPLFPLESSEVLQEVSEEVLADIESQIIPEGEDPSKEAKEEAPVTPPNEVEEGNAVPSPSPEGGEKDPVPVDEVIPDPIHIEPLQKPEQEEASKEPSPAYEKADITSETDNQIREELDEAEKELPRNPGAALNSFGALLHRYPKSARALYGRALSQDRLAEVERSNTWLEKAIATYRSVIDLADEDPQAVPLPLLRMAAEKCIDRLRFRGFMGKAVRVQQRLLQRFPDDIELRNQLGVTFLMMNQAAAARDVYKAVLEMRPDDGFAQVHYGFILKTTYDNNTGGIEYMRKGIESAAEGTQDGRFYFHLGDALQREGHTEEAYKWYDIAVEKGLFLSKYQRSLYNVDRLRSQPLWTLEETTYQEFFRKLEDNWLVIRKEGLEALALPPQDGFRPEAENLQDTGDWKQYELFTRGRKITANCVKAPKTCALVESFQAAAGCKRGQVKFSVMYPGTHVHAHTGPTNCRLRAHLGLVVPDRLRLRVGDNFVNWVEGKVFVFDDSWEHEVWHEGDAPRLILIVDVWHPELTEEEKKSLSAI